MFGVLKQFDNLWNGCGRQPVNFASKYQAYLEGLLQANIASMTATASEFSRSLVAHAVTQDAQGNKNSYYTVMSELAITYPPGQMSFPTASYLKFPATTNVNIQRDVSACSATTISNTTQPTSQPATPQPATGAPATSQPAVSQRTTLEPVTRQPPNSLSNPPSTSPTSSLSSSPQSNTPSTTSSAAPAATSETCNCQWKVLWDTFDIQGDFDPGTNGDDLHKQVSGCGKVTKWKFETTPGQDYAWHASGRLPIWTEDCVERAIHSAGGNTIHCSGHG